MLLMLPAYNTELIERRLDPRFDRVEKFASLLQPRFPESVRFVPVQRPGDRVQIGEAFTIGNL